ncbi:hypothetical protein AAKU52_003126 [Pedobacter sp. CG_S7]|uniref:hypothetical protein n=1 Tax=Pedobacter sp. CG_S7 TaxID=3143930 RepID=UPI003394BFCA
MEHRDKSKEIMLQQFTWQEFLIAILVLTLVWYAAVILIFYRKELGVFFSGKLQQKNAPLPHRWEKGVETMEKEDVDSPEELLGRPKLPEGTSSVSMGQIGFAGNDDDAKSQQLGLVPDVLQELKEVFAILEKEDGSKKDFFNLMEVVKEKYGQIGSNPNIGRINEFIAGHVPFHLSAEELDNLWD